MVRTAVIASPATVLTGRGGHGQQATIKATNADAQAWPSGWPPEPAVAHPSVDETIAQLEKLSLLKASGALTGAEFEKQKARILGS